MVASSSRAQLLDALVRIVGPSQVIDGKDEASAPYVRDWRGAYSGHALAVVRAANTREIADVVSLCASAGVPIVPQGGNTGMCGGAVPDESGTAIVLALGRMNRVLSLDARNDTVAVEAGCILQHVQQAAAEADRLFPLSLAAEGSCQIGGNVATNAGGINVLRYGNTRDLVLGLEAVLPDGSVWNGLRALRKDNRGYDLKQLFIGSEGTLGIITSVVLKLFPRLPRRETALVAIPTPDAAITLLGMLRARCSDAIVAYELIGRSCLDVVLAHVPGMRDVFADAHPWYVLLDLAGPQSADDLRAALEETLAIAIERGHATDAAVALTVAHGQQLWRLRESIPEAVRAGGPAFRSDIAVAIDAIPSFIDRATRAVTSHAAGVRVLCFGHLGDGNLHFNLLPPPRGAADGWPHPLDRILYDIVAEMNGSFSAEHGVGQSKRDELLRYKSEVEVRLMRTVKRALDPLELMNPGKIF